MLEKLFSLKLPPGLHTNGTVYQSKGRWRTGNCVRFSQGNIEPIGGWVQRTLTGATISGVVNAAISWQTNDGVSFIAVGTTTGLFIVTGASVVYNITPAYAGNASTYVWQLETFGSYLIAVVNEENNTNVNSTMFYWTGDLATIAIQITIWRNMPQYGFGVVTTPERFLVVIRGADPTPFGGTAYPIVAGKIQ